MTNFLLLLVLWCLSKPLLILALFCMLIKIAKENINFYWK